MAGYANFKTLTLKRITLHHFKLKYGEKFRNPFIHTINRLLKWQNHKYTNT